MSNDIEKFINLIYETDSMYNLRLTDFKKFLKCVRQTQEWNKFRKVDDIIKLNNIHINNAIKEILENKRFLNIIKEDTNIDISALQILI